jgi:hypothetical protein
MVMENAATCVMGSVRGSDAIAGAAQGEGSGDSQSMQRQVDNRQRLEIGEGDCDGSR